MTARSDFGLADPAFWAYFREMTMPPADYAWYEATKGLYAAKRQEFYDAAKAAIERGLQKTKTKRFTETHRQQAVNQARGLFLVWKASYEKTTEELDGVANPHFGKVDPWDAPTVEESEKSDAALEDLAVWLEKQTWSEFAMSLAAQYRSKGSLSEKQVSAATSMRTKVEAKAKKREEEKTAKESDLDLSGLPSGLYAVPGGDTRLKVRVSRQKNDSAYSKAGTIWVSDDAAYGSRKRYGKQAPGLFYQGDIQDALQAIVEQPFAARVAYGQLVGVCGSCGARLEDENSVAAGIGPICASKWDAA